jgi:hypothetical protein
LRGFGYGLAVKPRISLLPQDCIKPRAHWARLVADVVTGKLDVRAADTKLPAKSQSRNPSPLKASLKRLMKSKSNQMKPSLECAEEELHFLEKNLTKRASALPSLKEFIDALKQFDAQL